VLATVTVTLLELASYKTTCCTTEYVVGCTICLDLLSVLVALIALWSAPRYVEPIAIAGGASFLYLGRTANEFADEFALIFHG
jgi:hypothetical protein